MNFGSRNCLVVIADCLVDPMIVNLSSWDEFDFTFFFMKKRRGKMVLNTVKLINRFS